MSRPAVATVLVLLLAVVAAGAWWSTRDEPSTAAGGPQPAALPDDTRMGAVELVTDDLADMRAFYVDAVGLEVLKEDDRQVVLGSGDEKLLEITLDDRPADSPTEAGLYHSAILYDAPAALAQVLVDIATVAPQSYGGSADHAVSLAFYFADPDGNGLELYTDTPEEGWVWNDGLVTMGSAPLDPDEFIQNHLDSSAPSTGAGGATMGHVHLRVGDLDRARAFYADVLGFAVTAETDGALFYAAGGYHHHVATNTWGSAGAGDRPESLGLGALTVHVGGSTALNKVSERLKAAGIDFTFADDLITVDDPWGNTVRLHA